ncbi:hypothetical protein FGB62_215g02 [Gracilaria domingensis]|nr:hypothetical protein FGB62_215g02 [Gracilaria domingensis]
MKKENKETVLQFRARLTELESHLRNVGYAVSDSEKLRALLRGLKPEHDVNAEVIRGMDKSVPDAITLLIAKEASLSTSQEYPETFVKALNAKHEKVDCYDNPDSKKFRLHALVAEASVASSRKWYVDSGAIVHMCKDIKHFAGDSGSHTKDSVKIGDGNNLQIEGQGGVPRQAVVLGRRFDVHLTDVQYVLELKCNLISVGALQSREDMVFFDTDTYGWKLCNVLDGTSGKVVLLAVGNLSSGLYEVMLCPNGCPKAPTSEKRLQEPYA